MDEIAFPLDSDIIGYDGGLPIYTEQYGSENLRTVFSQFFTNGVFSEDMMQVTKTNNVPAGDDTVIAVDVNPGSAIINGLIYTVDSAKHLSKSIPLATSSQTTVTKYYHVVVRFDKRLETALIDLKETYNYSAEEDLERSATVYEIALATITAKSVYANGQNKCTVTIQDRRLDPDYCGLATPFREFDSEAFSAQIQAAIAQLEKQTKIAVDLAQDALDDTVAGSLENQINEIKDTAALLDSGTEITGGFLSVRNEPGTYFIHEDNFDKINDLPDDIEKSSLRLYIIDIGSDESTSNVIQMIYSKAAKPGSIMVMPIIHGRYVKTTSANTIPSEWQKILSGKVSADDIDSSIMNSLNHKVDFQVLSSALLAASTTSNNFWLNLTKTNGTITRLVFSPNAKQMQIEIDGSVVATFKGQ